MSEKTSSEKTTNQPLPAAEPERPVVTRRTFLRGSAALGAAALGAQAGAQAIAAQPGVGPVSKRSSFPAPAFLQGTTLRVVGTGVTLLDPIKAQAEKDLGITLQYDVKDGLSAQQIAVTQPQAWDLYDQWFNSVKIVWGAGTCQAVDVSRLPQWENVSALTKVGKINDEAKIGDGDAPVRLLYVRPDGTLGSDPSEQVSMLPLTFNVDAFGYQSDVVNADDAQSWGIFFDPDYSGKVGLYNDPATGLMDLALGAQAAGLASFDNIGNMVREEIDTIIGLLIEQKQAGQFRAFWNSFDESVNLMASGEVVVESMWSPAVTALRVRGVPVIYASPQEGYRGWHGGIMLNKQATGATLDAAYEYIDWWMNGWAGALVARQGYYFSIPENAKEHLSEAEWAYWYGGEAAAEDMLAPDGGVVAKAGEVRDGGSYETRMSNIAVWNSVMDEHQYLVSKWNEFLAS
jgi:putative spermidine/putrescine transport system substrate-binding protein